MDSNLEFCEDIPSVLLNQSAERAKFVLDIKYFTEYANCDTGFMVFLLQTLRTAFSDSRLCDANKTENNLNFDPVLNARISSVSKIL